MSKSSVERATSNVAATNKPKASTTLVALNPSEEELRKLAEEAEMSKRARTLKQHKKWMRRLRIFFCCLGYKKNKDSIADVASIFAEFYADLDVPSSEMAAGFVLLSKYQAAQRQWIVKNHQYNVEQYLSSVPITPETSFLDISTAEDSHLINDLIYYMNYSLAIFGWPMQMIDDPCMLCCICPYLKLSPCCSGRKRAAKVKPYKEDEVKPKKSSNDKKKDRADKGGGEGRGDTKGKATSAPDENNNNISSQATTGNTIPGQLSHDCDRPIILDDNCCSCNVASVERRLRAHNYEIIYVSYKVDVNVVPFLVAADHSKQSIVLAMRGSMSLSDMVTDMNGQIDKLPIENCPDDWLCHRGVTSAANYIKSTLLREHILDRAFNCRPDLGSQDYTLILCGHSLGAGVAAILGILLRPIYPNLKSYLYSPPGGMLSLPAVEYTKEFAVGILLGNDCVPRLGVAQLERLRYHILLSLKSSDRSTSKILAKALCPTFCFGSNKVDYDPSQSINLLYGTSARSFDYNGSKIPFQNQPQVLFVPGRLIHIVKNHSFRSKAKRFFNEPIYQAIWNDNTVYDRVMISEGMFYDHLPNHLMHAMKMLFSKTLPARRELSRENSNLSQQVQCESISEINSGTCNQAGSPLADRQLVLEGSKELKVEINRKDDNNNNNNNIGELKRFDENNNNNTDENSNEQIARNNNHVEYPNLSDGYEHRSPKSHDNRDRRQNLDSNGNDHITVNKNRS